MYTKKTKKYKHKAETKEETKEKTRETKKNDASRKTMPWYGNKNLRILATRGGIARQRQGNIPKQARTPYYDTSTPQQARATPITGAVLREAGVPLLQHRTEH